MAKVELRKATRTYLSGQTQVHAVSEVDLSISPGGFVALAGPSGSGKSTCLNMIGGIDTPSSGSVFVDGTDLAGLTSRELTRFRNEKIGFIFQDFNLIPVLTVYENVELPLHLKGGMSGARMKAQILQLLERVGLGALGHRLPRELSGGQQQRVAIARAVVKQPVLLIADEPTANLDSKTAREILVLMKELNESLGTTCVFSSHDPLVMEQARQVVSLRDGRVVGNEVKR